MSFAVQKFKNLLTKPPFVRVAKGKSMWIFSISRFWGAEPLWHLYNSSYKKPIKAVKRQPLGWRQISYWQPRSSREEQTDPGLCFTAPGFVLLPPESALWWKSRGQEDLGESHRASAHTPLQQEHLPREMEQHKGFHPWEYPGPHGHYSQHDSTHFWMKYRIRYAWNTALFLIKAKEKCI